MQRTILVTSLAWRANLNLNSRILCAKRKLPLNNVHYIGFFFRQEAEAELGQVYQNAYGEGYICVSLLRGYCLLSLHLTRKNFGKSLA